MKKLRYIIKLCFFWLFAAMVVVGVLAGFICQFIPLAEPHSRIGYDFAFAIQYWWIYALIFGGLIGAGLIMHFEK